VTCWTWSRCGVWQWDRQEWTGTGHWTGVAVPSNRVRREEHAVATARMLLL